MLRPARLGLGLLIAAAVAALALATPATPAAHAAATTPPNSPGPLLWTAPGGVNFDPINSIACPSTSLCVAIDRGGDVDWSTDPAGGQRAWQEAAVDPGNDITGISCPSTTLCVAVDGAGDVITSANPTGGATAWSVAKIDSAQTQNNTDNAGAILLRGISCPSTGLCVAVDAAGDALFSTNLLGGPSAWTTTHVDGNRTYGCSGSGLTCQTPLVGISCSSVSLCTAIDFSGNLLTSSAPTAALWNSTSTTGGGLGSLWGISCPLASFCATVTGSGGRAITFNPAAPASRSSRSLPDSVYGVWCQSRTLCLASAETHGGVSALLGSFDPTAPAATWSLSSLGGVNAVACPSSSLCLAADDEGNIAAGATTRSITALLTAKLLSSRHLPTIATLRRSGRDKLTFTSPIAAQVTLAWTVAGTAGKRVTIASASHRFAAPATAALTLRLTAAGRRLFRAARGRLTLTAAATFTTSTGSVTSVKKLTFTHPPK